MESIVNSSNPVNQAHYKQSTSNDVGKVHWTRSRTVRAIAVGIGVLAVGAAVAGLVAGVYALAIAAGAVAVVGGLAAAGYFYAHRHDGAAPESAGSYPDSRHINRVITPEPDSYTGPPHAPSETKQGETALLSGGRPTHRSQSRDIVPQNAGNQASREIEAIYSQLKGVKAENNPNYDRELTNNICAHVGGGSESFEDACTKKEAELQVFKTFLDSEEMNFELFCYRPVLEYQFKRKNYEDVYKTLTKQYPDKKEDIKEKLREGGAKTLLTQGELKELTLYRQAVEVFYNNQQHGDSNCQSFVNVMEYFFRGLGYQQVIGVKDQLDMPFGITDPSPIAGCYMNSEHMNKDQIRLAEFDDMEKFKEELLKAKDSDTRYVLHKTGKQGGAGHYMSLVRSQATGRFIVIDGQNRKVYPLLREDGTFTDQAEEFKNSRVTLFAMDTLSDDAFKSAYARSEQLLKQNAR